MENRKRVVCTCLTGDTREWGGVKILQCQGRFNSHKLLQKTCTVQATWPRFILVAASLQAAMMTIFRDNPVEDIGNCRT